MCGARACSEPVERRFCWEVVPAERERPPLVLQALGERDRAAWLRTLQAAGPLEPRAAPGPRAGPEPECALDDAGFAFVRRLVGAIEARGLEEQGLYRVAGVASKVARLVACAAPGRRVPPLHDPLEWETKTLTSALKSYLRALPDPLLTRALHAQFIAVASKYPIYLSDKIPAVLSRHKQAVTLAACRRWVTKTSLNIIKYARYLS